ncbi:MAG: DUF177 domain-containing protein [Nitrospiria bacterium]
MEIQVQDIPSEGLHLSCEVGLAEWDLTEKGIKLLDPIQIHLDAYSHGEGEISLTGDLSTSIQAECVRCLKVIPSPVHSDFHLEYAPRPEFSSDKEEALSAETLDLNFYDGGQINIDDEMQGQFFLSIPMNTLCHTKCRGLCPHCGTDLNEIACQCRPEPVDPRWAILKNFKHKD